MNPAPDTPGTTVLHDWHVNAGAKMMVFGGYDMPVQYQTIFSEHIATRTAAGLFDVSHMGRFKLSGGQAVPFLQFTTTNNVMALTEVGRAQYTLIPDEAGGAVDDAYIYRVGDDEYMLVVNAANREKDWNWLQQFSGRFPGLKLVDESDQTAMIAIQGPRSGTILEEILSGRGNVGTMPEPRRNALSFVRIGGVDMVVARTGYTGDPVGFEIFPPTTSAVALWELIVRVGGPYGLTPVGLGARDTLRLEAGLPLYGHELGADPNGDPIPICALPLGRRCVSFADGKGDFVGREALQAQHDEVGERLRLGGRFTKPFEERRVPRLIRSLALLNDEGTAPAISPARQGDEVWIDDRAVGWVTSGTIVPYVKFAGEGLFAFPDETHDRRAIALAYVDSSIVAGKPGQDLEVRKSRGRAVKAAAVSGHLAVAAPYARAVLHPERRKSSPRASREGLEDLADRLITQAVSNHRLRQYSTVNLIPSEQTPSPFVKLLSSLDPSGRYAEHRAVRAFGRDAPDVFYYQGTDFIHWAEEATQAALRTFLSCSEAEVRPISGQMANKAVFSGIVDYRNRFRRGEPARMNCVINNDLGRGGHLSAQYMGALRHFVQQDAASEQPAVASFPVQSENPYRIDSGRTVELIDALDPDLVVFGKSMVLHPEPVREIAECLAGRVSRPIIMYDMAHVLGLAGDAFQHPFADGADIVTGSTHKTFFGPQRGIIASNMAETTYYRPLWDHIEKEVFPGDVSNHHLGTLLGLLGACYEMLAFRDEYAPQVIRNAKAFARALRDCGIQVEGDPAVDYTETHQVIINVGKGRGAEGSRSLEASRIITNYQALPTDASFTDASGIRIGSQEMTRFGMKEQDFAELAELIAEVLIHKTACPKKVTEFRGRFTRMHYALEPTSDLLATLTESI
jgi:aminomethyltransferase